MVRGAWMAVVCSLLAGAAQGQEAYSIKLKDAGQNETIADWRSEEISAQLRRPPEQAAPRPSRCVSGRRAAAYLRRHDLSYWQRAGPG